MIHELKKPAMIPVPQPSRQLAHAHWDRLEIELFAAMPSEATARLAAQAKQVAL